MAQGVMKQLSRLNAQHGILFLIAGKIVVINLLPVGFFVNTTTARLSSALIGYVSFINAFEKCETDIQLLTLKGSSAVR